MKNDKEGLITLEKAAKLELLKAKIYLNTELKNLTESEIFYILQNATLTEKEKNSLIKVGKNPDEESLKRLFYHSKFLQKIAKKTKKIKAPQDIISYIDESNNLCFKENNQDIIIKFPLLKNQDGSFEFSSFQGMNVIDLRSVYFEDKELNIEKSNYLLDKIVTKCFPNLVENLIIFREKNEYIKKDEYDNKLLLNIEIKQKDDTIQKKYYGYLGNIEKSYTMKNNSNGETDFINAKLYDNDGNLFYEMYNNLSTFFFYKDGKIILSKDEQEYVYSYNENGDIIGTLNLKTGEFTEKIWENTYIGKTIKYENYDYALDTSNAPKERITLKEVFIKLIKGTKEINEYHNDKLIAKGLWKNNKKIGIHKEWYDNGVLKYEGNYSYGNPIGTHKEYYKNGNIKSIKNYNKSAIVDIKEYYENGKLKRKYSYNQDNLLVVGEEISWYSNGVLKQEGNYDNSTGKKYSIWKYAHISLTQHASSPTSQASLSLSLYLPLPPSG